MYVRSVDMRRSCDGLHAIVLNEFNHDVQSGDMFLFLNKRRDRIKILWWDGDGLILFMKRLEADTYQLPAITADQASLTMERTQVELMLAGIDLSSVKSRKRYQAVSNQPASTPETAAQ